EPARYAVPAQGDDACQIETIDWCSLSATTLETRAVLKTYCDTASAATGSSRSATVTRAVQSPPAGVSASNTRAAKFVDSAMPAVLKTFLCRSPFARLDDANPSRAAVSVAMSSPNTIAERKMKPSENDTRQCGSGSVTESRPKSIV